VSASRVPVGRFAAALALVVGAWAVAHGVSGRLRWKELTPGIEFATLRGEPYCRAGSSTIGQPQWNRRCAITSAVIKRAESVSFVALSTRLATLTASPIAVNSRRAELPMFPTTAGP